MNLINIFKSKLYYKEFDVMAFLTIFATKGLLLSLL